MKKILLKIKDKKIPIYIGKNTIKSIKLDKYIKNKDVVIITNTIVAKYHLDSLLKSLKRFNVESYILPDGEKQKNISALNKIHNFLIKKKFDRQVTIVAFGGGVIGDLAGFASDTFLRGVDLIHIPTTLLAQVDSSIGGKTGVNHVLGKNLIGSFKHPNAIIIDINYLKTLPIKQYVSGLAEVIKYGVISKESFLKWLNINALSILNKESDKLLKLITISVKEKISIVQRDERESNIRAFLNYGHTIGHAIESSKNYKGILHGEAVSIGIILASAISVEKSSLNIESFNLIEDTLVKLKLPITLPKNIKTSKIMEHLSFDKKKKAGKNNFVLLKSIGKCHIINSLSNQYIAKMVKNFQT